MPRRRSTGPLRRVQHPRTLVCLILSNVDRLPALLIGIRTLHPSVDVLLVTAGQPDAPDPLLSWFAEHDDRVRVLPSGRGRRDDACVVALRRALTESYDLLVEFDADEGHRPEDLAGLLRAAGAADVVLADRTAPLTVDGGTVRLAVALVRRAFARFVLEVPFADPGTGLRAYWAAAASWLLDDPSLESGWLPVRVELAVRAHEHRLAIGVVPLPRADARACGTRWDDAEERLWTVRARSEPAPTTAEHDVLGGGAHFRADGISA